MNVGLSTSPEPQGGRMLAELRGGRAPKPELKRTYRRMLALVWPHRRAMGWGMVLGLGVAATYAASLGGIVPVLKVVVEKKGIGDWFRNISEKHPGWYSPLLNQTADLFPTADTPEARMKTLLILMCVLVGVNIIGNVFRVISQYLVLYASNRAMMDLRRRMYRKALQIPMVDLAGNLSNTVNQFMSDSREIFLGITTLFGKVAREPLKAICVLGVALWMDARLTLVALAIAPIAVVLLWYFGRKVRKSAVKLLQGYGILLGALEETLQGIVVVKGYAREGYERKRMWGLERRMFKHQLKLAWIEAVSSPVIEVLGVLIAAGGIIWLASRMFSGELDSSTFITMVILLSAMLDPIRKIANVYNMVQRAGGAANRVFTFLDSPEEVTPANGAALANRPHEIDFDSVGFRYSPQSEMVLKGVSLKVKPGECIAIIGPNGSGKTTLLRMLPRFLDPQDGGVRIDGTDVRALNLKALRQQIAIVSQTPVIFARSVRENIAYGNPSASIEEIREAAKRAFAAEFIEQWADKYETVMGEFGTSVSGGQRQRISIARAFLKPASILIFDEATSEVDAESERKIHAALNELRRGKTTFLIAHRHTVMDMADRIVVMDEGAIVDVGTHAELSGRCPLYQALHGQVGARHAVPLPGHAPRDFAGSLMNCPCCGDGPLSRDLQSNEEGPENRVRCSKGHLFHVRWNKELQRILVLMKADTNGGKFAGGAVFPVQPPDAIFEHSV